MDNIPAHRLAHVRKVIAWLNATTPYHHTWTEEEAMEYALAHLVCEIESGKPSSLLSQERGWIQYCNNAKRTIDGLPPIEYPRDKPIQADYGG